MFTVRGKSGKIVGRYVTKAEAERRIAQLKAGAARLRPFRFVGAAAHSPTISKEPLSVYLAPKGAVPGIGPERGRVLHDGISRYTSPHGSFRYVFYQSGVALAALQVMSRDGHHAIIANVYTVPEARKGGLARELLSRARRDFKTVVHAAEGHLSEAGKAWRDRVGSPVRSQRSPMSATVAKRVRARAKILRSPSKSNWVGRQRSLDRYSIEELVALRKTIENAPGARRPTDAMGRTPGIYIFTPKTRKKLDDIDWAITSKLKELRAGKI